MLVVFVLLSVLLAAQATDKGHLAPPWPPSLWTHERDGYWISKEVVVNELKAICGTHCQALFPAVKSAASCKSQCQLLSVSKQLDTVKCAKPYDLKKGKRGAYMSGSEKRLVVVSNKAIFPISASHRWIDY
ncbi:hypothetical protein AX14_010498 [Amanita brunnescens Koide BX004]|nr:hypothetical protein AX14_010498 [Amanita brunnescens Koide BX004]